MTLPFKAREVVESMTRDRVSLQRAVLGLSTRQTAFRSSEDAWSINDILHHLALTDESTCKLLALFHRQAENEALPDDPNPGLSVMDSIDPPKLIPDVGKVVAPDRVTPRSAILSEEALARLADSREILISRVQQLARLDPSRLSYDHPFYGELDLYQWLLVTGRHERRHTRQIERVMADEDFPES